jgi:hypothetical protein
MVPEAGPSPFLGPLNKPASYWVPVEVPEFLDSLVLGVDVEIVISRQPERALLGLFGDGCFQCLDGAIKRCAPRLGNEQMHMLRHDHIAQNEEDVASARGLKRVFEKVARPWIGQKRKPVMATEGEEVKVPSLLVPF